MYSWEINNILMENNYIISSGTYLNIISESPQLVHIAYKPYNDCFIMRDNNGQIWEFQVFEGEKGNEN